MKTLLALLLAASPAFAADATQTLFTSPNGVQERCVALAHTPGVYSKKDLKAETELCSYDIYRNDVALCPKTWSTSPGTMLYSTDGMDQATYEATKCTGKKGHEKLAKFKTTMNQHRTSGTFSPSSLLYYHFSRFLSTVVHVPVSVYRTIDKNVHYARVSSKAVGMGAMNRAGWEVLRQAEKNPASYQPTREVFTADGKQIYGVLLDDGGGERYGAEFNGTRVSKGGDGQNNDFQQTPPFTALRSEKPFAEAVQDGVRAGKANVRTAKDLGSLSLGIVQMGLWMRELTEITFLDYVFAQQDRVGNIDYEWYWLYRENGAMKAQKEKRKELKDLARARMGRIAPPAELASLEPVLVQKSIIGDNDAGGRLQYANYTKRTKMLEKIRHYDAGFYRRIVGLNADFAAKGPMYQYVASSFQLDAAQVGQIVKNTAEAVKILQDSCRAGRLQFDLDLDGIVAGEVRAQRVDCERP